MKSRRFANLALSLSCVAVLAGCATTRTPAKPTLDLTLAPHSAAGKVDHLDVTLRIAHPDLAAGAKLAQMALVVVSIPSVRYDGAALEARDDRGPLPLTAADQPPTPTMTLRQWNVNRATVGDVVLQARALPRVVGPTTRNGPLFDLREESGSMHGAGLTFLPLPDSQQRYRIRLHWNLRDMPKGSIGVWSLGVGDVEREDTIDTLAYSYYAAGPMYQHRSAKGGRLSMYWFSPTPFDSEAVGSGIESFYDFASRFFQDPGGSYRVFIRRNPSPGGGGTALRSSFMFGWGTGPVQSSADLQGLLAHEITHNWPKIDEPEHGDAAWYAEGLAEYYSILLSRRAGAIDDAEYLKRINQRASAYYTNPYRALPNAEVARKFWVDPRAQRVPYGRGFIYFLRLDAQLRAGTQGRRSLDDLVLEVLSRQRKGEKIGLKEWSAIVERELGAGAVEDFAGMQAGALQRLPANSLAPCLRIEPRRERPYELGFDGMSLGMVKGVVAGSNAERAGLREGDAIVKMTPTETLVADESREMSMTIRRDGVEQSVTYLPRSEAVDSFQWVRTETPLASCRY